MLNDNKFASQEEVNARLNERTPIPEHRKYHIVGFPLIGEGVWQKPVAAIIDYAATYEEAEQKAKWAKENHIHGATYRTHAGRKIATGKIEIRKTRPGQA